MNKNYILRGLIVCWAVFATTQLAFAATANINTISPNSGVSVEAGVPQTIRWTSSNYPAGVGVNINLLRQASFSPSKFEFVKMIKNNTPNDGQEVWIPSLSDKGNNLVIQVSCSLSFVFPDGCLSGNGITQLSIIDKVKRQSYTASIFSAIGGTIKKIFRLF